MTTRVFDIVAVARILALPAERHLAPAEALIVGVKEPPDRSESFERIIRAVVLAVAIGPFVITGGIDQRHREVVERLRTASEHLIAANGTAALEITRMNDECQVW
jgi:hypothetical protein